MRKVLVVMGCLFLAPVPVMAQTSAGNLTNLNYYWSPPAIIQDDCGGVDKTPAEAVECKLRHWRKEVERFEAKRAEIEKELAKARERVSAFTDAQVRR